MSQLSYYSICSVKNLYKKLYENSPDLLRTINRDGIILDCNQSYADYLGYTKDELIGTSIFKTVANESMRSMRKCFENWRKIGQVRNVEVLLKKKDGTIFPALINANNLYDEKGNLVGSNTTIKDISEIYEIRKELLEREAVIKKQYEGLQKLDKAKDEFTNMMAHELKTPLVPIKSYVDVLLSGQFGVLTEKQREKLEAVKLNTNSLLKIISDFLHVMKIDLNQLESSKKVHDLSELIDSVVTNLKPAAEKRSISIMMDLQKNILCSYDKTAVEQVLTNLVENAINYCKENDKIHIKLGSENAYAKVVVKDDGVGIARDKLDKVFQKFYQIDTSLTRERGGAGLGLAVCKCIIESHGGKIWAESEGEDKGSGFHFLLPLEKRSQQ